MLFKAAYSVADRSLMKSGSICLNIILQFVNYVNHYFVFLYHILSDVLNISDYFFITYIKFN